MPGVSGFFSLAVVGVGRQMGALGPRGPGMYLW